MSTQTASTETPGVATTAPTITLNVTEPAGVEIRGRVGCPTGLDRGDEA